MRNGKGRRGRGWSFPEGRQGGKQERGGGMAKKKKAEFKPEDARLWPSARIAEYMDEREIRFCEEYIVDMNGTQAAIRAGYKPGKNNASAAVQASRLLRDPRVRLYRAALIRESVEDMDISREAVALKLLEIFQRCMAAVPVLVWNSDTKSWENSGEWKFDPKGAAKALEQLTRLLGLDAPVKLNAGDGLEALLAAFNGGGRSY